MNDQLITFKTAKLAKEKGFEQEHYPCFGDDGELHTVSYFRITYPTRKSYFQSTQSLLQRWLREVHKLHLAIQYSVDHNQYSVNGYDEFHWNELKKRDPRSEGRFPYPYKSEFIRNNWIYNTYEEALEVGLQEALKLIK